MNQRYVIVDCVDGKFTATESTAETLIDTLQALGYAPKGIERSPYKRRELRGQPTFNGLLGPMWGGETSDGPIIRYETLSAYEQLSI